MLSNDVLTGDVRQTLDRFRRSIDQLFENFYGYPMESGRQGSVGSGSQWMFAPVVESAWDDNHLRLRTVLPGVTQNDVKVSIQNNQLVIEGERKTPDGFQKNNVTHLSYGKFYSALTLPSGLDLDKMNARLHDGVLDIDIPVSEKMKARQIQIQTGEQRKGITA